MAEQARVTVAIPAYKAEATIQRAVDSVLAQQGVDTRVVVVVDGRLDRTVQQLDGYDPDRVQVIVHETNRGSQASRNRGLAAADGEFVMFLDCDDFLEGAMLSGLVCAMREKKADIGFGPMQVFEEKHDRRRPPVYRAYDSTDHLFRAWMAQAHTVAPCAILWRTDFLREIGGWDEGVARNQDGEVVMRTILCGGRFAVSRDGRGVYVHHDSVDRITKRTDNLGALIQVGEMILASQSRVISDDARREGVAGYFYRIALRFYSSGRPDLADRALRRAQELGFKGHGGPRWHRFVAALLGLPLRYRISNYIKRRRLFGFSGFQDPMALETHLRKITAALRPIPDESNNGR